MSASIVTRPLLSAVHRGVAFEQRSLALLRAQLSMSLVRVGGKADGGVDLLGWWWLPARRRVRVLGQCKAEKKKLGPNYVREMEGVLHRHLPADAVALVVSESPFSKATLLRAHSSPVPFFLLHLPPRPEDAPAGSHVGSAFWNPALAGTDGLLRGEVQLRWERQLDGGGRPGLWTGDTRLENMIPPEETAMQGDD
jgi:hypothetical protein